MNNLTVILTPTPQAVEELNKKFALLCESGVWDIRGGSAVLHFDKFGTLVRIERHDALFDTRAKSI